ncbi:hypothetical protein DFH11DRAFT_1547578 [Phellopilus nigrolimitatus]|nr:hypothetical protein DFH11DRAFT_1547578 [Phellopilus nigrolimitatus]
MAKRKKTKDNEDSARVKIVRVVDSDSDDATAAGHDDSSGPSTVTSAARVVHMRDLKSGRIGFRNAYVDDVVDTAATQPPTDQRGHEDFSRGFEDIVFEDLPEQLDNHGAQDLQKETVAYASKRRRAKNLSEWLPFRSAYLDELVRHDGRAVHAKWTGEFWEKTTLRSLGLKVHLGHTDKPCVSPLQERFLVVYHVNGFHLVDIVYCGCDMAQGNLHKRNQLLRARWYPATTKDPGTAFTFAMLDQFHELTLQGKLSAHDYYQGLAHMSDGSGIQTLRRISARSGRAHDPLGIENTKDGELALDCPACPHPGKNLPDNWKTSDTLWIYMLVLAIDANFRLKSKDRNVTNDPALGPGWAYLVDPGPYHEQLRLQSDKDIHKVERGSCESTFQAMEKATTRLNDGYLVTGVGAVICARSGLVRKNGVGDLQKGESIVGALVTLTLVTYDIACQWSKKLSARVREYPLHLQAAFFYMIVNVAVPKFHLKGHGQPCQSPYSLNLLRHSARTDGEGIERGWSHINPIAMATREMGPGFRHDTIDDHWSAWNWHKIIGLGFILLRKLTEAEAMHAKHRAKFNELSQTFEVGVVATWSTMVDIWQKDPLHAPDPYADPDTHVSLADLRKELAKEEAAVTNGALTVDDLTASTFLVKGLELEELQRSFKALVAAKKAKPHTIQSAVAQDAANAAAFAAALGSESSALPADKRLLLDVPPLCLPSELNNNLKGALPTQHKLINKESRLRFAQANDSLAELRRLLRLKSASLTFKKINNVGQRENTRARSVIIQFTSKIELTAERYRAARAALQKLDPTGERIKQLQPLLQKDVRGIDEDEDDGKKKPKNHQRSEGRRELSWIWTRMRSDEGGDAEIDAGIRVEWAKAQARAERWQEEITLVVEEMRRTLAYCDWKAAWWREQATRRTVSDVPPLASGLQACAEKQAATWEGLATSFATRWYKTVTAHGHAIEWPQRYRLAGEETRSMPTTKKLRTTLILARMQVDDTEQGGGAASELVDKAPAEKIAEGRDIEEYDDAIIDGGESIFVDEGEDDCRQADLEDWGIEDDV